MRSVLVKASEREDPLGRVKRSVGLGVRAWMIFPAGPALRISVILAKQSYRIQADDRTSALLIRGRGTGCAEDRLALGRREGFHFSNPLPRAPHKPARISALRNFTRFAAPGLTALAWVEEE